MKNRKSVRTFALLFLFAMILVQTCSGGVAISGSFYAHDYELAQGEEISSNDIYIVVFNKVDERVSVDLEYEAPEFIEVGLSTKSCFLDPDEYERIYISLKAKEDAVPGDYKVKVIVIIKEVEGDLPIKVLTSAVQEADVTVVGEYAQSEIPWYDQEGMQIAKSQNKPAMIFFYSDRCPASAKLAEVFADTRVIKMSKNFVPIVGSSGLDRQYGIRYVPTIVFTNSYGMAVHRVVGYQDADTLVNEMQYALMLSTTLDVPFKAQVPPGSWDMTKNCGQACSSMVFCYYWNTEPSEEDIKKIDNWLYEKYGDPINNYNGWETATTKLKTLACEYANFPKSYKASGWNLEKLKQEIDAGHPVIVAIIAGKIPYRKKTDPDVIHYRNYKYEGGHFVVVKGYTSECIVCNDPGTGLGDGKQYYNNDFKAAMDARGGAVVVVIPSVILPSEAKPVLTSPLRITPEIDKYYVGDTIRAEFTINNIEGAPITLDKLLVGGRFNDGMLPNGEYPDFTSQSTTLQPDFPYKYTGTLTLNHPGEYKFFITYYIENPTSEEKKLLDGNNWNTCIDLGKGLTDADRIEDIRVFPQLERNVLSVPDDHPTIQAAVNAASAGDTIIVKDGIYYENVDVTKSLTIRSTSGNPTNTIVQAKYLGDDVFYVTADYVNISGFTVEGATLPRAGICLLNSDYCNISSNKCSYNGLGIIALGYSSNNTISSNDVNNNDCGISLVHSSNNTISGNDVSDNNYEGISLYSSSDNTVSRNTFINDGLVVSGSINDGLVVSGSSYHNAVEDNTVNNKPLVYLEGASDYKVKDAGQVILINCRNIKVENLNLSNTCVGIELLATEDSIIADNTVSNNNWYGITLDSSSNNTISGNDVSDNNYKGISLVYYSSSNTITGNNVSGNNGDGISIWCSNNNTISGNDVSGNNYTGIYLYSSSDNSIYLNNFINHSANVFFDDSTNIWDSTEEITYTYKANQYTNYMGNYWDDYKGTDTNKDGIGDKSYSINSDNDYYPLMERFENYIRRYDLIWRSKAPMPTARSWTAAVVYNGKIYVVGGCSCLSGCRQFYNAVRTLEVYDPLNNSWEIKSPMSIPRVGPAVAAVDGKIYVFGGFNRNWRSANPTVEIYDIATDTWSTGAPMSTPRSWARAVVLDGKIYVLGGVGYHYYNVCEMYDPATNTGTSCAPFKTARYLHAAVGANGKIYIIGGDSWEYGYNEVYLDIQEYNPLTNSWITKTPMPTAANGIDAIVAGNKIWVFGGGGFSRDYDIATDQWENKTSNMNISSSFSLAYLDGVIYRFGGGGWGPTLDIVEAVEIGPAENNLPNPPANLAQFKSDGETVIPVGGMTDERTVILKGNISDPDGDKVKLQVELRRLDEYNGAFLQRFTQESDLENSNSRVGVPVYGLIDGNYHWQARTVDEHGLTSEWVCFGNNDDLVPDFSVKVNYSPIASFTYLPPNPLVNQPLTFNASSSYDSGGNIINYKWNFGDGKITSTSEKTLTHSYSSAGDYTVILTVTDNEGATDSISKIVSVSPEKVLDVPFFSQRDPAWRDKKLDHSPYSLGEYGCALTSAAMVAKYFGYDTDPDKLNTSLTAVGGLDTSGIISWKKVEEVSDGKVAWIESVGARWSRIDQELSSENPVISSVKCPLGTHFIVFVGKSEDEHYFLDPYDNQRTIRVWPNGAHGEYSLINLKIYHGVPTTLVGDGSFCVAVSNPAGAYICNDSVDFTFDRNLKRGDRGDDVKYLQIVLNANPATQVTVEGPGSPYHETNYYGQLTEASVIKFQTLQEGLTQTGEIDEATRAELNKLHLPVKHVPNGWVLNVTNTHKNKEIYDGCVWWEVEDVTDGIKGWVAYQNDATKYLEIGDQDELNDRIKKLNTKEDRFPVILHAVTEHRTEFLPDNFPLGLILAMTIQESGGASFDNEIVALTPWGRGIMQIDTPDYYVGAGSGIRWYNNGAVDYCRGKEGHGCTCSAGICYCEACKHYYTNTIQGIEANIRDGLYVLSDKYNCQCCYDSGKDAEWDVEEGLYLEEMGDDVIFYSLDEECKGGDGYTYDSRIEKIKIGSVHISCNEFKVIDTVWRYNGRSIYPEGSCMGNDYLRCVADRLNEIERIFGYEMPDKDTWVECLKAVSSSASLMKRIK